MAVFCSVIAGVFCLQISYPLEPELSVKVDTNGLGGSVLVSGKGWTLTEFGTDVIQQFDKVTPGAKQVCKQDACLNFRRDCNSNDGKINCRYRVDMGILTTFELHADGPEAVQRAEHSIAIYRGDKRQSDFPLADLDAAAK